MFIKRIIVALVCLFADCPPFCPPATGDCNADGEVNFADVEPFVTTLTAGSHTEMADCNFDGTVNGQDIAPFVALVLAD